MAPVQHRRPMAAGACSTGSDQPGSWASAGHGDSDRLVGEPENHLSYCPCLPASLRRTLSSRKKVSQCPVIPRFPASPGSGVPSVCERCVVRLARSHLRHVRMLGVFHTRYGFGFECAPPNLAQVRPGSSCSLARSLSLHVCRDPTRTKSMEPSIRQNVLKSWP